MSETSAPPTSTTPSKGLPAEFSEPTRQWFRQSFAGATRVQALGWPQLVAGNNALLVAPTGSGKTLAAFLWAIDRCAQLDPEAERGVRVLYLSPLKALAYDIERNLRAPLVGIQNAAAHSAANVRKSEVHVRTGDTPQRDRARQARNPTDILVTTPESLFLTLGSQAATTLDTVDWVIVDEVHVFAPSKRGVHLALSLERLAERTLAARGVEPQRIGLSATVKPADAVARFLGGDRPVQIVDASEPAHLELSVRMPEPKPPGPNPEVAGASGPADALGPHTEDHLRDIGALPEAEPASAKPASYGSMAYPKPGERAGIWPAMYPELIELILAHRSTILFTNSRGLCERLSQRLNEMWAERVHQERLDAIAHDPDLDLDVDAPVEDLVSAHHGSVSHARRAEIEENLKAGRLRCIVATSSLELGIDMGAVDLVVLVESPGSVARGLQRVGRAGHSVGERSRGVIFPKFSGDLLECAVVSRRMLEGTLEPIHTPRNPLDVLAQQVAALCVDQARKPEEILALVRRSDPYRELAPELLHSVLDMLSGRYPSDDFADLRPRLSWDRAADVLSARRGTKQVTIFNAGTIPDRGLYSVHLGADGPRIGELDEEMVYESRTGDVILLGASSWRVLEITRDRVMVEPAPGEPGRMPFWHGDGPGRPVELGEALGAFLREFGPLDPQAMRTRLLDTTPLSSSAADSLVDYLQEQKEATGTLPSDEVIVVERFRDELGDWRLCLLSPFGSRVHAPWAMALQQLLSERAGFDVETMYTDDGVVLRLADSDDLPDVAALFPDPEEVEDLVVDQVGSTAMFATLFRENAARALLLPRRRAQGRTPLWLARLRSKTLLASVRKYSNFPIILETYRESLRDRFDVPALVDLLRRVQQRDVRVVEVETPSASPFARSLVYAYIAQYLYEQDSPLAERKAQALTLDRNLLRELVGHAELRELLDPQAIADVESELQATASDFRARDADELWDLLRRLGDLTRSELVERAAPRELATSAESEDSEADVSHADGAALEERTQIVEAWIEELVAQRRAGAIHLAGEERIIAADDAGRYRDATGAQPPRGVALTALEPVERALESLVTRWARTHGPFLTGDVAQRFGLTPSQLEPLLENLERQGTLTRGEIRPGGSQPEWCDVGVLRRIKRRTLARLRGEVAPVDAAVLADFLPRWHGLEALSTGADEALDLRRDSADPALGARPAGYRPPRRVEPSPELVLDEALDQLEGAALPFSALTDAVLPARVPGYRDEMLDLRAATGQLVWVGRGALGPRDGRVALYRRENAMLLDPPNNTRSTSSKQQPAAEEQLHEPEYTPIQRSILDLLARRGACFTTELHQRLRADHEEALAEEIEAELWDLVWQGLVTNDTFLPLRSFAAPRSRRSSKRSPARLRSRRGIGAGTPRRGAAPLAGGRWSLVEDLVDEGSDSDATEWAFALTNLLLERHGIVSRETAIAEEIPGAFTALYPTLRAMEEAGRVRRGYFVEGLSGRQFALAGAVEKLREIRVEAERSSGPDVGASTPGRFDVLAAADPANAYGSVLPWPEGRRDDAPRPRRVAGAWVILCAGELVAFLESGTTRRSVVTFRAAFARFGTPTACRTLTAGLQEILRRERRRSLRVQKIDGQLAASSELAQELLRASWEKDDSGLRVVLD